MTKSTMTPKRYLVLAVVAITAPLGDTLLAIGMKRVGPVSLGDPGALVHAVATPYVALGIALLIGFFASYLSALTWADLTYVLPTTSIGNVFIALLSRFWLHEEISPSRWAGIVLITLGVGFVANGEAYTEVGKAGPAKVLAGEVPPL
jgi:drug/metabolite transporter (DMT)-like permease